jgi:hypothetical protein
MIPLLAAFLVYAGIALVFYFRSTSPERLLYSLSANTILFPFILGWMLYRRLDQQNMMLLAVVTAAFAVELGNFILSTLFGRSNELVFYLYTPFEYLLITSFFSRAVERPLARRIIGWSIPVFFGIWLLLTAWLVLSRQAEDAQQYTSAIILVLEGLLLTSFAVYIIVEHTKEHLETVFSISSFWVGLGVLTYFGGNLITFALMFTAMEQDLWVIHAFNNVLLNLSYSIGFSCRPQPSLRP